MSEAANINNSPPTLMSFGRTGRFFLLDLPSTRTKAEGRLLAVILLALDLIAVSSLNLSKVVVSKNS